MSLSASPCSSRRPTMRRGTACVARRRGRVSPRSRAASILVEPASAFGQLSTARSLGWLAQLQGCGPAPRQAGEHAGIGPGRAGPDHVEVLLGPGRGDVEDVGRLSRLSPSTPLGWHRGPKDEDHAVGLAALNGIDGADPLALPAVSVLGPLRQDALCQDAFAKAPGHNEEGTNHVEVEVRQPGIEDAAQHVETTAPRRPTTCPRCARRPSRAIGKVPGRRGWRRPGLASPGHAQEEDGRSGRVRALFRTLR